MSALVLGDLKPDYTRLIRALGGQVISVTRSKGVNPLDLMGAHAGSGEPRSAEAGAGERDLGPEQVTTPS